MKNLNQRLFDSMKEYLTNNYHEALANELVNDFFDAGKNGNFSYMTEERQKILLEAVEHAEKEVPYCPYEIVIDENNTGKGLYRLRLLNIYEEEVKEDVTPYEDETANFEDMLIFAANLIETLKEELSHTNFVVNEKILKIIVPLEQYKDKDPSISKMLDDGIIYEKFKGFKMYFPNGIN